jgi:hypothetical protein
MPNVQHIAINIQLKLNAAIKPLSIAITETTINTTYNMVISSTALLLAVDKKKGPKPHRLLACVGNVVKVIEPSLRSLDLSRMLVINLHAKHRLARLRLALPDCYLDALAFEEDLAFELWGFVRPLKTTIVTEC